MGARSMVREPTRPRLPDSLVPAVSWDEADALGWAEIELRAGADGEPPDGAPSGAGVVAPALDVSRCRLVGVSMIGAVLARSRWADVVFERCDLSGADLTGAALTRVELRECRLNGALLGGARLRELRISDGFLDGTHLRLAKGERVWIERSRAVGIDLSGMEATDVVLAGCDLTGADVSQARLPGVRLVGSTLDGLRGAASLRDAVIDADQVLPLGVSLLAALGITIEDDSADGDPSDRRPPVR